MHKRADDAPGGRHTLSDWLDLHELDAVTCQRILHAAQPDLADVSAGPKRLAHETSRLDLESAWLRIAEAMRAFFPAQRSVISDTLEKTTKTLVDRPDERRRALTLNNGPIAYPTIIYSFNGEAADVVVMAHEFAHALQIRASGATFVPPIIREVCAFLGEWALLSHVFQLDEPHYHSLVHVWQKDNLKFLATGRDRLKSALLQPDLPYQYSWNYPISRHLAIETARSWPRDRIWALFEGHLSVRDTLKELAAAGGGHGVDRPCAGSSTGGELVRPS